MEDSFKLYDDAKITDPDIVGERLLYLSEKAPEANNLLGE